MANLEEIITERILRWLGHVIWMEDCSIPNQAFNWNLSSRNRKPGRPRKTDRTLSEWIYIVKDIADGVNVCLPNGFYSVGLLWIDLVRQ